MGARPNGNGSGGRRNGGQGQDVPRWVRTLFDEHERLLAQMKAEMAKTKAEHEERMDGLERLIVVVHREEIETRRQTRELVLEIGRVDRERAVDRVEFLAAIRDIRDSLKGLHGRVSRLEGK